MKKVFYIGLIAGALLGIAVSLGMDILLGNSLGGGWGEAVAHDMNNLFKSNLAPDSIVVIVGVILVIGIIAGFGAIIGGIFSIIVARIFIMLTKE